MRKNFGKLFIRNNMRKLEIKSGEVLVIHESLKDQMLAMTKTNMLREFAAVPVLFVKDMNDAQVSMVTGVEQTITPELEVIVPEDYFAYSIHREDSKEVPKLYVRRKLKIRGDKVVDCEISQPNLAQIHIGNIQVELEESVG